MRVRARVCVCERERGGGRMQQYLMGIGGTVGREREREEKNCTIQNIRISAVFTTFIGFQNYTFHCWR